MLTFPSTLLATVFRFLPSTKFSQKYCPHSATFSSSGVKFLILLGRLLLIE